MVRRPKPLSGKEGALRQAHPETLRPKSHSGSEPLRPASEVGPLDLQDDNFCLGRERGHGGSRALRSDVGSNDGLDPAMARTLLAH